MRLFAFALLVSAFILPRAHAQGTEAGTTAEPTRTDPAPTSTAPAEASASDAAPAASPQGDAPAAESGVSAPAPSIAASHAASTVGPTPSAATVAPPAPALVSHADAWVAFEAERDQRTRAAERFSLPLFLAISGGLGTAYAVAADVPQTSRILAAATAGVTLAAIVPTAIASTRRARRTWFSAASALFAFGAGATIITAYDGGADKSARWAGASVALGGLAFLPLALIPGFPEEEDYRAYAQLPDSERPAAAAKLLARIDRFEQRVTAIGVYSAIASAAVLCAGALVADNKDQARTLGGLALIPLGSVLTIFGPRLFVRNRVDRYSVGDAPQKLPLNGW